jgi:DNA-binding transcriptional LysR family regulator
MDVHLRELRYFVAVADELHFTRAAERLFVSQPALSKQVRALERQLRRPLFERDRRAVRLTAAGRALLEPARALLRDWAVAEAAVGAADRTTLIIGMSTGPGRGVLPAIRARLTATEPAARLEFRQVGWGDPTAGLADRSVDAAFVWLPLPDPAPYATLLVAREPRLVALPVEHPLAGQPEIALAELLDEPFLALPASAGPLREHWLALPERRGRPVRIAAEVTDSEGTYEAITAGLGVCLLAAGNATIFARGGVVMRPVSGIGPSELVLAWRRDAAGPLLRSFVTACADVVGTAPPAALSSPWPAPGPVSSDVRRSR